MSSIYTNILLKKFLGVAETNSSLTYNNEPTSFNKSNIINSQIYSQPIPSIAPTDVIQDTNNTYTSSSTYYPYIQYVQHLPLTAITTKSVYKSSLLQYSIPFNYDLIYNSYQYTLTTSKGSYNESSIVPQNYYMIDHDSGYLTFINGDWDETVYGPPIISFYRYNNIVSPLGIQSVLPPTTTTVTLQPINNNATIVLGSLLNGYINCLTSASISTFTILGGQPTGNYTVYLTTLSTTQLNITTAPGLSNFYFSVINNIPIVLYLSLIHI